MADDKKDTAAGELPNPDNLTKYKTAADVANRVLAHVITLCVEGAEVIGICEAGDKMIDEECGKVYKKAEKDAEGNSRTVSKGVAFPTCISVNNCVCHFSPLRSEAAMALKAGDMVKIDLGVHVDGFAAPIATTVVVGASASNPITGPQADVMLATYYAAEAALRMLKAGKKNTDVTELIGKVSSAYKVTPVENMVSYQISKDKIDQGKNILQNPSDEQKSNYKKEEFEANEVYAIDVVCSSGDGKAIARETRTTVYKKTGTSYQLKMKTSRAVFSEIAQKFTTMPFSLRALEDEKKARMGVVECQSHGLVEAFPVLWEKEGTFVAQYKYTAIIGANGTVRITNPPFDIELCKSELAIEDEEIKALLAEEAGSSSKKKKTNKKKTTKKAGEAADAEE